MEDASDNDDLLALCEILLLTLQIEEEESGKDKKRKGPKKKRNASTFDQRLSWSVFCQKHVLRGSFKRRLRMTKESFDKLLSFIYEDLLVKEVMAEMRGGSIIPEICLYCTLRWLAGGSYLDVTDVAGISQPSFYRVVWKTIYAIVKAPELSIKWPKTGQEIRDAISGFTSISDNGVISNCAGVGDGFLLRIRVPNKKEVGNVRSFFSGHYQCYGINIQAVCDHNSRFIYISMAAPGVSKDRDAAKQCGLTELVEGLPRGVCCIVDAAYEPTEHMVPVYQGVDKRRPTYDNFNFYASQCRIRIEMAFGLMVNKFGILQRPLGVKMKNIKWLVQAVARIHNFVIDERLAMREEERLSESIAEGRGYLPSIPHDENGDPISLEAMFSHEDVLTYEGHSELREAMAARVAKMRMIRPAKNKIVTPD
jgi:hypothetical protein